jgi:divalent metal cation (Fe/Co/Zn/Cd) transporter
MKRAAEACCGILIAVGATSAWHYWQIDGLIACVVGVCGLVLIAHAFDLT